MLEQSAAELRATVEELEKRYDTIDNEGNEWKTRFETQQEMNEQLERQILMLQNKVQEAKTNLKDVRPPARRQAWESSAPIETENKIDKDEKVRIFGSTRLKNISYKEKFIQSKQQRSMMQQNLESGDKTSNIRGDLTFRNSDTLRKNRRSKKYAKNGASQKVGAMEEPLQQSDSKEQSNRKKTVKEFMAERQQDDDVEARTQKNSSLEKHSRKTPVKEQTSGKPPTEISNKMSSEKAENSALVRSVSDGKVIMKRAEKTDLEETVRKAKSEIIQVKRNEKSTKTPDVKKSSEPSVAIEIPANDPQDTLQENEVDDIKPTSKFPRTIKIRTKPGSYLRAKAYVAARDLASRGSKTNQSEYSPEDLSKFLPEEWSKPGTAMTKSTGISINIAISPRGAGKTPRDLKNFDDLSDPTGYHVRMLEKQKIVLGNQLKEIQDRLDHESQANPHMIRMLDKEKNVLHNQLRDMEWRLDQESKAYHKANDERKSYALEINTTKGVISELVTKQKMSSSREHLETIPGSRTPRAMGSRISLNDGDTPSPVDSPRRSKIKVRHTNYRSISNIPEDRRILDPKRGPIQKTAAVKNLPSLEST
ncbi:hypothetical protein FSP39_004308 [Pinctada imbricata]|uniref:Uncharacterized protein n=1 Tax=Pinctada imbricata TaxID=66713 RepID=A0AA88Y748_PINIB|nr:hypothetical protein FSP39_004308 [Pinctada imbricata]